MAKHVKICVTGHGDQKLGGIDAETFKNTIAVHESIGLGAKWTITDMASGKSIAKSTNRAEAVKFARAISTFSCWKKADGDIKLFTENDKSVIRGAMIFHLGYDPKG